MPEPKYPKVKVKLTGTDGNAFAVIGTVRQALKKANVSQAEIDAFTKEAMSGDYQDLLCTCYDWVHVR